MERPGADMTEFAAFNPEFLLALDFARLEPLAHAGHPPRILLLYGSLRKRSFSRLLVKEAAYSSAPRRGNPHLRPRELPLPDATIDMHPKVQELRNLSLWSEGQVWCSPERHGA
jgi:arsenic resistance protein ArsH